LLLHAYLSTLMAMAYVLDSVADASFKIVVKHTFLEVQAESRCADIGMKRSASDSAIVLSLCSDCGAVVGCDDDDVASSRTTSIGSRGDIGRWADVDFETQSLCSSSWFTQSDDEQSTSDMSMDRRGLRESEIPVYHFDHLTLPPGNNAMKPPGSWCASVPFAVPVMHSRTTLMLDNVSVACSRTDIINCLDSLGFQGEYDLVYLPTNFKTWKSCHYAFVNMTTPEAAVRAMQALDGLEGSCAEAQQALRVQWSDLQGFRANVEIYRNSPVMHPEVPEQYRPLLLVNGSPASFPPPTKSIKVPSRLKSARCQA